MRVLRVLCAPEKVVCIGKLAIVAIPSRFNHTIMADLRKVLISDSVDPKCKSTLEANGIQVTMNTKLSPSELVAEIPVSGYWIDAFSPSCCKEQLKC